MVVPSSKFYHRILSKEMARICTWNVNGIRATKNLAEIFKDISADVFCIQETKIQKDQIDEKIAFVNNNYSSCFAIPKQNGFKGRSGCATYYLDSARPNHAEFGLIDDHYASDDWKIYFKAIGDLNCDIKALDSEGRLVVTCHDIKVTDRDCSNNETQETRKLFILNVYFPRADKDNDDRKNFKAKFNKLVEHKAKHYLKDPKSHVIIACDINIQHKQIDSFELEPNFDGCPDRKWLTDLLTKKAANSERHMVDSYRMLYKDRKNAYTCWPTVIIGSRENNLGFRIDLMLVDSELAKYTKDVIHLTQVKGSDHCPVLLELENVEFIGSKNHPLGSSRTWPNFRKRQTTLTSFFITSQKPKSGEVDDTTNNRSRIPDASKRLKLSPVATSPTSHSQSTCTSTQMSIKSVSSHEDKVDEPLTAYQKIMQKKSPVSLSSRHCEKCGLICEPKTNKKKATKNFNKTYYSCPNPKCKYFRWVSTSTSKSNGK